MKKIIFSLLIFGFLIILTLDLFSFSTGITGLTKKNGGNVGCICHGNHKPSPQVLVFFNGPDSVAVGQTVNYRLYLLHGPAVRGGFDVASSADTASLKTSPLDATVRKQDGELTHISPKPFVNDTVFWTFRYTAPLIPQYDTLFAVANSTNFNGQADTLDRWNFSANFPVRIYVPIGIINNQEIANSFSLGQNYPNPFNPRTIIKYELRITNYLMLKVFDMSGNEVKVLVDRKQNAGKYEVEFDGSNLPSGVYFYRITSGDASTPLSMTQTKKMVLLK